MKNRERARNNVDPFPDESALAIDAHIRVRNGLEKGQRYFAHVPRNGFTLIDINRNDGDPSDDTDDH